MKRKEFILSSAGVLIGSIASAKAPYALEIGIQAMDTNKVTYWDNINYKI